MTVVTSPVMGSTLVTVSCLAPPFESAIAERIFSYTTNDRQHDRRAEALQPVPIDAASHAAAAKTVSARRADIKRDCRPIGSSGSDNKDACLAARDTGLVFAGQPRAFWDQMRRPSRESTSSRTTALTMPGRSVLIAVSRKPRIIVPSAIRASVRLFFVAVAMAFRLISACARNALLGSRSAPGTGTKSARRSQRGVHSAGRSLLIPVDDDLVRTQPIPQRLFLLLLALAVFFHQTCLFLQAACLFFGKPACLGLPHLLFKQSALLFKIDPRRDHLVNVGGLLRRRRLRKRNDDLVLRWQFRCRRRRLARLKGRGLESFSLGSGVPVGRSARPVDVQQPARQQQPDTRDAEFCSQPRASSRDWAPSVVIMETLSSTSAGPPLELPALGLPVVFPRAINVCNRVRQALGLGFSVVQTQRPVIGAQGKLGSNLVDDHVLASARRFTRDSRPRPSTTKIAGTSLVNCRNIFVPSSNTTRGLSESSPRYE